MHGDKISAKAELLQLKPHPFICMRNFINEKLKANVSQENCVLSMILWVGQSSPVAGA